MSRPTVADSSTDFFGTWAHEKQSDKRINAVKDGNLHRVANPRPFWWQLVEFLILTSARRNNS
jgi:hypothetical protein